MLTLNLLSFEQKHQLHQETKQTLIKQVVLVVIVVILLISVIFYFSKKIVLNNFEKFSENTSQVNQVLNQKIEKINKLTGFIQQVQKEHINWANLIMEISAKTPTSITLTSLQLNKDEATITISGLALTRDELLKFKNNLEKLPELTEINLPLQNMTQKTDVNFTIKAKLKIENIN